MPRNKTMPHNKIVIFYILLWNVCIVVCFDPFTALGGITAIASYYMKCSLTECCDTPYVALNYTGLKHDLTTKLHGQHIVIPTILRSIKSHMEDADPKKPLVFSFHGWTGIGKSFVSQIIVDNIYKKKEKSTFVHYFNSEIHFTHKNEVGIYKDILHSWIHHNVTRCERSIFIFDELDSMPEGLFDVLTPFLGHNRIVDGVNYRKAIFIFLSNTGGDLLMKAVHKQRENGKKREDIKLHELQPVLEISANLLMTEISKQWENGNKRDDIKLHELQPVLESSAYNQGGLKNSKLIGRSLIDHFVPFFPLERSHVRSCIIDELRRRGLSGVKQKIISGILDDLSWYPEDLRLYSKSGCKKISQRIGLVL